MKILKMNDINNTEINIEGVEFGGWGKIDNGGIAFHYFGSAHPDESKIIGIPENMPHGDTVLLLKYDCGKAAAKDINKFFPVKNDN